MKLSINIPENLSEVKLRDYIQLVELFKNAEQEHETVLKIRAVSILTGISLEDVVKIPINELNDIFDIVNKLINETPKFQPIISVNGIDYGFIPDMENLMTNEYLDLELYFGKDILKTVSILYRPVKNRVKSLYTIEEYKGTKDFEKYNDFPASAYVSCMLFFWTLLNDLLKTIPQYLEENLTESQRMDLEANGVGILQLTKLLEETDLNSTILSQNLPLMSF